MTEKKDDPFTLDPSTGAEGLEQTAEAAAEIVRIVSAILSATLNASTKPGLALSALRLANHALRAAIMETTMLTETEAAQAETFTDGMFAADNDRTAVALAIRAIDRRSTVADASDENIQGVLSAASLCLDGIHKHGNVHPATAVVVLYAAREMAFALLKHQYPDPDEYEDLVGVIHAMENAVRPGRIDVVPMPDVPMSKGGSA